MPQQPYGQQPYPKQPYPQQSGPQQSGPYPPQQAYPQQPYPQDPQPQQAMGAIALTIQGSVMTSSMIVPNARFNGYPVPTKYGLQNIPVPAGPLHIELEAQWMRTYGQAALDVNVQPGQVVPVFYAAPMHQFTTGNIGHVKQSRKGMGFFVGLMSVLGLIIVLSILLAFL